MRLKYFNDVHRKFGFFFSMLNFKSFLIYREKQNASRSDEIAHLVRVLRMRYFNCRYKWQPSPWSTCRANSPISSTIRMDTGPNVALTSANPPVTSSSQICGGGIQMRGLTCLRLSDSRPVKSLLCGALTLLPTVQQWVSISSTLSYVCVFEFFWGKMPVFRKVNKYHKVS